MPEQLRFSAMSSRGFAILLTVLGGCADAAGTGADDGEALGQVVGIDGGLVVASVDGGLADAGDAGPPNEVVLRDENDAAVARVVASGRGCPIGSWDATMAPDGLTFTATFSELNITLSATQEVRTASCLLAIFPPAGAPVQYSARTISYAGQSQLGEGVVGAVELRHYYEGIRATAAPGHAYVSGPFEGPIALTHEVDAVNARWTPCVTPQRGVNVDLLLRLSNGVPRASGTLRSDQGAKLVVQLMTRACPPVVADAGTPR